MSKYTFSILKLEKNGKENIIIKRHFMIDDKKSILTNKNIDKCEELITNKISKIKKSIRGELKNMTLLFKVKEYNETEYLIQHKIEYIDIDVNKTYKLDFRNISGKIIKNLIEDMSLMDLRNDLLADIHKYAIKEKGKWWATSIFYNKEVTEYKKELWERAKTLQGALELSNEIND